MALLNRNAILEADDLATEDVEIPEWGGKVRVRALTGAERDKLESSVVEQKGKYQRMNLLNFRAKLVVASVVDENGNKMFSDSDIKILANKNASALDKIAAVASKLSGMNEEDVEELTEGFEEAPEGASTSD